MVSIGRSLIEYPIFRLTLFMAAGIFLFDTFLRNVAPISVVIFLWLISVIVTMMLPKVGKCFKPSGYGLCLSVSMVLFGGLLTLMEHAHVSYEWPVENRTYEGTVLTLPKEKNRTYAVEMDVQSSFYCKDGDCVKCNVDRNIILYLRKDSVSASLSRGDGICFNASVSVPMTMKNGQKFDYAAYLTHRGISGTAFADRGKWMKREREDGFDLKREALAIRDNITDKFRSMGFSHDELAILTALAVGDKSDLTPEIQSVFTSAGTSHILALSGMHVGIVVLILFTLLAPMSRMKNGRVIRSFVVVLVLWCFAFITGLSSSVVRAVSMFTLYSIAAMLTDEKYQSYNALTLTAFFMLVYNPFYLFDVGFQLSFVAVFSLILFYPVFRDVLVLRNPMIRYIWNVMCLSVAAQLGTLPLVLFHFGAFPTYFLVANIIVAPMTFLILLGAILVLLFNGCPLFGEVFILVLNYLLHALNTSMAWIRDLYVSQLTAFGVSGMQMLLMYLILFSAYAFYERRTPHRLQFCLLSLVIFLLFCLFG